MADGIKISELPEIETLRDGCCFPVISEVDGTMQNVKIKKINLEKNLVNNNYSEEETVIGKWIDGKPIYRRMFNLSEHTSDSNYYYTPAINDLDVLINAKVIVKENDYSGVKGSYAVTYGGSCKRDTKKIVPNKTASSVTYELFFTIVEYTKTTDVAEV